MRNPSVTRGHVGRQPRKVRREKPRIVGNRNAHGLLRKLLDQIAHETLGGHAHREEIERVRACSRVLGHSWGPLTLLRAGDYFTDRSPPETTSSKLHGLIET